MRCLPEYLYAGTIYFVIKYVQLVFIKFGAQMFVRVKSTPKSPRKSVQIVENIRNGSKTKQKIVHYVGIAMDDEMETKLKQLAEELIIKIEKKRLAEATQSSLFAMNQAELEVAANSKTAGRKKHKQLVDIIPAEQVAITDIFEEKRIIDGVDDIATQVYDGLGFNELLDSKRYSAVLKDVVLTRLVQPYSKLKLCRFMLNDFGKDYSEDQIYRMMDKLYDKIDDVKLKVFNKTHALMPEVNVLLFDVTTLYCESISQDGLREFGFSKDGKFNNTQLVLALATNELGLPIGYELFQGNCAEVKTLCIAIENWKKLFNIKSACFIGDRAMFSHDNLQLIEAYGYEYIIAAKLRGLSDKLQEQILDESHYIIEDFGKDMGWVGNFDYPVEDGYSCNIVEKAEDINTKHHNSYVFCGDKKSISQISYIDTAGTINNSTIKLVEIQPEISKLRLSSAKCSGQIMTVAEYQQQKTTVSGTVILIIQEEQTIDGEVIDTNLVTIAYNQQEIRIDSLSEELQQRIIKESSNLNFSSSLMQELFASYVPLTQLLVPYEVMLKLFPEHKFAKRRICVSYKPSRARNDFHKRDKILKKLETKQGKSKQLLKTIAKKYMTAADEKLSLDWDKIAEDQHWDGMHGIVTNIHDTPAKELIMRYGNLWRIEEAFRINKHNLSMRPIYHYKSERIKAHIAICYMTFAVLKLIQYQTQLTQPRYTIDNIIETMLSVQSSIHRHKITKDQYRIPGVMSHEATILYRAFGIKRSRDAEIYLGK